MPGQGAAARFLVAVDGSTAATAAVGVAAGFAIRWDADLDVVHVLRERKLVGTVDGL